jgi:hypothetical protein
MHRLSLWAALHALLLPTIVAATNDIALSSFTPRIDKLPALCQTVYDTRIQGCSSSDFNPANLCSQGCLNGLAKIGDSVKSACSRVDVGETSIIGVFQNDIGIPALCPNNRNAPSTTAEPPKTTAQTSTRPTTTRPSTSTGTSTSTDATTQTSSSPSSSATPSSSSTSSGLATDPNASTTTLATSTTVAAPSPAPESTQRGGSQLSNPDSGGGSPFDVVASGSGSRLRHATLGLAAAMLLAVGGAQV